MQKKIFVNIAVLIALLALSVLSPVTIHNPGPQLAEAKILTLTPIATPSGKVVKAISPKLGASFVAAAPQ